MNSRRELLAFIEGDADLQALLGEVRDRLDGDPGHDLEHLLRVAVWTIRLGGDAIDAREAVAAALLHDIVNVPKDSPGRAHASQRCAEQARGLLDGRFDEPAVGRICDAIRDHSFSRGAVPEGPLGRALQDADRLEAVGAIGLFRTVSTGTRMGARYFHPSDPWGVARELDDTAFTVDHFFEKLLRLAPTLQTQAGRAEAARRTKLMRAFLEQLAAELGEPIPAQRAAPQARGEA